MTEENENLQEVEQTTTIDPNGEAAESAQGEKSPEDTQSASNAVIEQQASTIDLLMEQNARLQAQIEKLLRSGAQINDGSNPPEKPVNPFGGFGLQGSGYQDEKQAFKDLGKEIGKR